MQELRSGSSYLSSSDSRLHFGLGSTASIDRVEVLWPNGLLEEFPGGSADRFVHLIEGRGASPSPRKAQFPNGRASDEHSQSWMHAFSW